jgi:hypothetical protein
MALVDYNGGVYQSQQLAMGATSGMMSLAGGKKENIRVAVRVRPLLPHEGHREEVIYYPTFEEGPL